MNYFYSFVVILLIAGCAPRVLTSGPMGVTLDPIMMFPDMKKAQELADEECAKYNRIAKLQGGVDDRPNALAPPTLGWALPTTNVGPTIPTTRMRDFATINYSCVDRPVEKIPAYPWPELPQIVP